MPGSAVRKLGADLLFHAIIHGNTQDAVALLQDNEVDLHARNVNGLTPLHYAVETGHLTFVEMLLKYGAQPNIQEHHEVGMATPLYRASEKNLLEVRAIQRKIAELLLLFGADPTIPNKNGFTALHVAARHGHIDIVNLLINKGIDPNIRDKMGYSASYWAKQNGHSQVLAVLPPPLTISIEEFYEHKMQMKKVLGLKAAGSKKKKGKKGKKKKK